MPRGGLVLAGLVLLGASTTRADDAPALETSVDATLDGDGLSIAPGGWARVRVGQRRWACVNSGSEDARVALAAAGPVTGENAAVTCAVERATDPPAPPAAAEPSVESPAEAAGIFVLDLKAGEDEADAASVATNLVTGELSGYRGLKVSSGDDVRRLLEMQATRELAGCDTPECQADLAGALGARYLVTGEVTREAAALQLNLALVDAEEVRTVAREQVVARDLEDLAVRTGPGVHNLLAPLLGHEARALPPPELGRRMGDWGAVRGALLIGAAVGVSALLLMPLTIGIDLAVVQPLWVSFLMGAGLTGMIAGGAAALATWAADAWAGAAWELPRALLAVAGGATTVAAFGAVVMLGSTLAEYATNVSIGAGGASTTPEGSRVWLGTFAGLSVLGAVLGGVVAGGAYELSIGFLGDRPAGARTWGELDVE